MHLRLKRSAASFLTARYRLASAWYQDVSSNRGYERAWTNPWDHPGCVQTRKADEVSKLARFPRKVGSRRSAAASSHSRPSGSSRAKVRQAFVFAAGAYVCMHACAFMRVFVCVCIYNIYTYIHICVYIYIYVPSAICLLQAGAEGPQLRASARKRIKASSRTRNAVEGGSLA